MTTPAELPTLPAPIQQYLDAHDVHDTDRALATFAADATVVDDGHEFRGTDEIRTWLSTAASEFTYTTTLIGASLVDDDTWLITNHLEGDFPGGVVDLQFQFALADGSIETLTIAP